MCYFGQFDGDSTPARANTWTCKRKTGRFIAKAANDEDECVAENEEEDH